MTSADDVDDEVVDPPGSRDPSDPATWPALRPFYEQADAYLEAVLGPDWRRFQDYDANTLRDVFVGGRTLEAALRDATFDEVLDHLRRLSNRVAGT